LQRSQKGQEKNHRPSQVDAKFPVPFLGLKFEAFCFLQAHFAVVRQCERHIWIGDLEVDHMPTRNVASSC
jgi:hypothetical protein